MVDGEAVSTCLSAGFDSGFGDGAAGRCVGFAAVGIVVDPVSRCTTGLGVDGLAVGLATAGRAGAGGVVGAEVAGVGPGCFGGAVLVAAACSARCGAGAGSAEAGLGLGAAGFGGAAA